MFDVKRCQSVSGSGFRHSSERYLSSADDEIADVPQLVRYSHGISFPLKCRCASDISAMGSTSHDIVCLSLQRSFVHKRNDGRVDTFKFLALCLMDGRRQMP